MRNADQDSTDEIQTQIGIGERLQVRILDEPNPARYHSRIIDIVDGTLVIAWPIRGSTRVLVHRDQILDFYLLREEVPYKFTGLVDHTSLIPLPQITIIPSSAIMRIQRRQNFRIRCLIPVEITGSGTDARDGLGTQLNVRTRTCDLSAGGMAFWNSGPVAENAAVEAKLELPDDSPPIKIPCRVVYSVRNSDDHALYRTGLQYLAISESERARIVRFVYRTQLKGIHR